MQSLDLDDFPTIMRGSGLFLAVVWLLGLILGIDALPDCQPTGAGPITIGKESYVCITINGKRRVLFTPKADEFTAIRLSGSETLRAKAVCAATIQTIARSRPHQGYGSCCYVC